MLLDLANHRAIAGREDFHQPAGPSECDQALIRADIRREHGIEFIAYLRDALAGGHIPYHDVTQFCAHAATRNEQAAIVTEPDNGWEAFRKWEDARQLERVGII